MFGKFTVIGGTPSVQIDGKSVATIEVRYSWKTRSEVEGINVVHVLGYWPITFLFTEPQHARAFEIDLFSGICKEREVSELFPDAGELVPRFGDANKDDQREI